MTRHLKAKFLFIVLVLALMSINIAGAQETTTLRLAWWGGDQRAAMYQRIVDLYVETHPGIAIETEFAGFGPYFERLATQVAGGNAPDIIHMHQNFVNSYASRGAMLDLTPLVEAGTIDLSHFSQGIIDSGKVDGKIYMITLGNSAPGTHYNARMFDELGVARPALDWTWNDFVATATELVGKLPEGVYASADTGMNADNSFEPFVRQKGYQLYTDDGKLGFPPEVMVEFWSLWQGLREAGALPPMEMSVERATDGVENNVLVTGDVAIMMLSGNQHRLFQQNTPDELGLTSIPRSNDPNARFGDVLGGAYIGLSSTSRNVEAAAAFINWFVNDPEAAKIFNGEHGPVGSSVMQEVIAAQQGPADQRLANLMAFYAQDVMPPQLRPPQSPEVIVAYTRIYQELAFGTYATVEEAVAAFFDEAEFILE